MVKVFMLALCAIAVAGDGEVDDNYSYGMSMVARAYDAACWYEKLKVFPTTDTNGFTNCDNKVAFQQEFTENPSKYGNKAYMDFDPEGYKKFFGQQVTGHKLLAHIDSEYKSSCEKYANDFNASPKKDESDALNDPNTDVPYPYKALAFCIISTLRKRQGDKAVEAVKEEKTHKLKHWITTLLDRENEFRALHGVSPLRRTQKLQTAAQAWAEKNAAECRLYHSSKESRYLDGKSSKQTGESLSGLGGKGDTNSHKANAAYVAADGWYEENLAYPWYSGGYKGDGQDALFEKIGHFTQSVWKESQEVGYGYAYNENCPGETHFITARYYPAGNMQGAYDKNVLPAKK